MRYFLTLFFFLPLFALGANTFYHNFEYGMGFRDDNGRYMLHGIGTYVTFDDNSVPVGWDKSFRGS